MAKIERRARSHTTRISLTDSLTGKRRQVRVSARTKKELDAKVASLKDGFRLGNVALDPETTPVSEYVLTWLDTASDYDDHSRVTRRGSIEKHIGGDPLGSIPVGKLRRAHVQAWIDRKRKVLKPGSLYVLYRCLRNAIERAVLLDTLAVSPFTGLDLPAIQDTPHTVFTVDEARRFVAAVADDPIFGAFWTLAVVLGLRRGELIGLQWSDYDAAAGTLHIQRTLTRTEDDDGKGAWSIGEFGKTPWARRRLQLPAVCAAAMKMHRTRQVERRLAAGPAWVDTGLIFDAGFGATWTWPTRINRELDRIARMHDLPRLTPHELRHTAATHMIRAAVPIPAVARILGHKSSAVTMQVYAHVIKDMEDEATTRIDALWDASERRIVTSS